MSDCCFKKENYSNQQVANVLNRAPQTINNEIKRGTITQLKHQAQSGKVYDYYSSFYDSDAGQLFYDKQQINCGRRPKWTDIDTFIEWADDKMLKEKWSPDIVVGFALKHDLFNSALIPCISTLYQWIDRGIMRTKNIDLLEKLSRKTKVIKHENPPNKKILGVSIEQRPEIIDSIKTSGHWEIDTVVGNKTKCDAVLLTLAERQTRFEVIFKLNDKDAKSVERAIQDL